MLSFNLVRWLKSLFRARGTTFVRKPHYRLSAEVLEARLAPALTFTWTGAHAAATGGVSNFWSDTGNWAPVGGVPVAPTVADGPVDLVFQSGGASYFTACDNIAGLVVDNLTIVSGTYNLTSSLPNTEPMLLANPVTNTASIIVNSGALNEIITIPIQLGNTGVASSENITVQAAASLTIGPDAAVGPGTGQLMGNSAAQLATNGVGLLTLTADNNPLAGSPAIVGVNAYQGPLGFQGPFTISDSIGNGTVAITDPGALGASLTSDLQSLNIAGATSGNTLVTVTYPNGTTNPSFSYTFTGNAVDVSGNSLDAESIATGLNTIFNALGYTGTPVNVTETSALSATGGVYGINFGGGTLAGIALAQLQVTVSGVGSPTATPTVLAPGGNPNITTITQSTQLQVNVPSTAAVPNPTVNNPIFVYGAGPDGFSGAIVRNVAEAVLPAPAVPSAILAGNITLNSLSTNNVTIGGVVGSVLQITGQISDTTTINLTKEGAGTLYLNPSEAPSAANNFHGGNTYRGNTNDNNGTIQIGQPFALGAGGATTFENTGTRLGEVGTLQINYTTNPLIPAQYLFYAQVQTISFSGAVSGTTQFTVDYNGVTTPAITYNGSTVANLATQLNALSTIGGIGASVTVTQTVFSPTSSIFYIIFKGSLGGLEIPTVNAIVTSQFGTGLVSVGTANGIVTGVANLVGGGGYTSAPIVTLTGGGGSGATAVATVSGGAVTSITVTSAGEGYTSPPTVSFLGGGGIGASRHGRHLPRHRLPDPR